MSTKSNVELTRSSNGWYRALDEETGETATGPTKAEALNNLSSALQDIPARKMEQTYDAASSTVQKRVAEEGTSRDVVNEAIAWARQL